MQHGTAKTRAGPVEEEHEDPHEDVDDLQYRERFHSRVEGFGQEIPEYLGPEEALNSGGDLVYTGMSVSVECEGPGAEGVTYTPRPS